MNPRFYKYLSNKQSLAENLRYSFSKPTIHMLLIAALSLLVYSNTFNVPFVFDDNVNIVNNPIIKSFTAFNNILEPPVSHVPLCVSNLFKTRFLGYLTFALNYALNGLDVIGYHIINLLIHIISALLVYWFIVLTSKTPFFSRYNYNNSNFAAVAFFSALLFVCHPIQTGAVTYIVQRFASLATMFYLLALVLYIKFRLSESIRIKYTLYISTVIVAVAAMLTKEISFTLPVVIAMYEFMFFEGKKPARIVHLIPLFLTMMIIPLLLSTTMGSFETMRLASTNKITRLEYFFTQFTVLVVYIRLLFLPLNQNLDYDYPIYHSLFNSSVLFSMVFLFSILNIGLLFLYRSRIRNNNAVYLRLTAFGIFWFFITLSVESSIIPIDDLVFEHRLYLASVGFFIAVVTISHFLIKTLLVNKFNFMRIFIPVFALIVIILSGATYARNATWSTEISLFEDVIQKSPLKHRAHYSLGFAYLQNNRINDAIKELSIATKLKPDSADAHNNLGVAYSKVSKFDDAVKEFTIALQLKPENAGFLNNLGMAYMGQRKFDDARNYFEKAIKTDSGYLDPHGNLGLLYEIQGDIDKAAREYRFVLQRDSNIINIHNNLGVQFFKQGNFEAAINKYKLVIKLKPDLAQAHYNLALAYHKQNRLSASLQELTNTIRLKPDLASAHYNLGLVYRQQGHFDKALTELRDALELKPDYIQARQALEDMQSKIKPKG